MQRLNTDILTWTGLLGRWIEFAQASLALPDDAIGAAWRDSVPHIINLQAVTFALADIENLRPEERPLAIDKATVLIDDSVQRLEERWRREAMPTSLGELIGDARLALRAAEHKVSGDPPGQ